MHTNETSFLRLSQFVGTDIPNPLVDYNGDMQKIDEAVRDVSEEAGGYATDIASLNAKVGTATLDTTAQNLSEAVNELKAANDGVDSRTTILEAKVTADETTLSTLAGNVSTVSGKVTNLETAVNDLTPVVAQHTTEIAGIKSQNGNATLVTVAQTLSGAINELAQGGGSTPSAASVSYDNTSSGMTATNVQAAIDELHDADGIAYDNTASGLAATNVQAAIDKLAEHGTGTADITITGDGVKTVRQCLTALADAVDFSKVTPQSVLVETRNLGSSASPIIEKEIFSSMSFVENGLTGANTHGTTQGARIYSFYAGKTGGTQSNAIRTTFTLSSSAITMQDQSSIVVADGDTFEFYY